MAKGRAEQKQQDQQGTPTYIIMSVLFTIVIFAFEGLKDTITLNGADGQTRSTSLGFIALGLSICFFWRRLHESFFKSLTALFFASSLWAYLVASIALPLIVATDGLASRSQLIHQSGLGGIVITGFCLMAAILYHQKAVPALLMTILAGFLVSAGSLWPLLKNGPVASSLDFTMDSHTSPGVHKKAKILAEDDEDHDAEHSEDPDKAVARGETRVAKITHEESAQDAEDEPSSHKKSKMKMAAKDTEKASVHADDDTHEDNELRSPKTLRKMAGKDQEQSEQHSDEEHAPRTLSSAQKARLENDLQKPIKPQLSKSVPSKDHAKVPHRLAAKQLSHGPHWEYSGEHGPERWGQINEDFKVCNAGLEQSPINIVENWPLQDVITLDYKPSTFQVLDNGHTVQVNVERGNFASILGQRYELKQFHFHAPSEHLVDNRPSQLEVHFVHVNDKGQLAVIGALINSGRSHIEYQQVFSYMPVKANEPIRPYNKTLNLRAMLPNTLQAFRYNGSLTTPPCSEKVNWNVLQGIVQISQDQINLFKAKYPMNARPAQPLNYRKAH